MILTPEEIAELTDKVRFTAQARVLKDMGIPYRLRPDGSIVVFRVHLFHETAPERQAPPALRL